MSRLRGLLRLLDPWALLVLGGLVALAVVILLATPGPWQRAVGEKPAVSLVPAPPRDIALYVFGGRDPQVCTAVVWVHVSYELPALTAVLVSPETRGFSPGGGWTPVRDLVVDAGPADATAALSRELGVPIAKWMTLDKQTMHLALSPEFPTGTRRVGSPEYRDSARAWALLGGARQAWPRQYADLRAAAATTSYSELSIIAFANYVLGFGFVHSNLDLEGVTSLAKAVQQLSPSTVDVRAAPAVVDVCRGATEWGVDALTTEAMYAALDSNLIATPSPPTVTLRPRAAGVLLVLPRWGTAGQAYAAQLRARLAASARGPVTLDTLTVDPRRPYAARLIAVARRAAPLAVVLATPLGGDTVGGAVARQLQEASAALLREGQQAVVCAPLPAAASADPAASAASAALRKAVYGTGLPVSSVNGLIVTPPGPSAEPEPVAASASPSASPSAGTMDAATEPLAAPPSTAVAALAARLNVQTLVRAVWPGVLAPRLTGTRIGFGFEARRHTLVGVAAATQAGATRLAAHLRLWGYRVAALRRSTALPEAATLTMLYYRPGERRAALALAGDLGLPRRQIMELGSAPAPLALQTGH